MIYLKVKQQIRNINKIKKFDSQEKFKNQMVYIDIKFQTSNMQKSFNKKKLTKIIKFHKFKKKHFLKNQNKK